MKYTAASSQHEPRGATLNPVILPVRLEEFHQFHNHYNTTFPSLDLVTSTSFIALARSIMATKVHTIKLYLSGIIHFSRFITDSPGTASDHPQLTLVLRGLKRQEPPQSPRHLPLTPDLLSVCIQTIHSRYNSPHVGQTLETLFVLAFFDFLRCSEFTASPLHFDPHHYASGYTSTSATYSPWPAFPSFSFLVTPSELELPPLPLTMASQST